MCTYTVSGLAPLTKSFGRRAGALALALAILTVVATTAWGYWSTLGSGTGSAIMGTLTAPTTVSASATPGSGDVNITWQAPADGANPTGYYVTRTDASDNTDNACESSPTSLLTVLSCTDTSLPSGSYTYVVTAVLASWSASSDESNEVTVSAPSKLSFSTQPSASNTSQTAFATQPVVEVQDAAGNRVTTDTSSVTLALTSAAGASLTCTANPKSASAGVATFAGCKVDKAGTYTLTATDGSLTSAVSASFTVTAGAADRLAFTTQPSATNTSQSAFATQPVVTILDAFGNTVTSNSSNVGLSLTTPAGASLICAANPKTASAGVATFTGCNVDKAGSYTLTATGGSLASAVSASFDVSPGAANRLAFTTQPGITNTSQVAFDTQPSVTVLDAFGNTVSSDISDVTLSLTSAPAGASLTCTANPKAASAGVSVFAGCKVDKAGTYTLTATDGSLGSATSASFTVMPGAASKVVFTSQPSTPNTSQTAFATQPVVTVQDAFGNTVTGDTSSVTLALTSAPAGATLTCTTNPKAASNGVATFAGCKLDKAGSYTLTAIDGSLASATSNSFTVTPGAASKLAFTTQPSTPNISQAAFATQPVVEIQDAVGNRVTADTSPVTLALTSAPAGASLICTTNPKAAVAGVATFTGCMVGKAGSYTLTATDGSLAPAISVSFNVTPGTPTKLTYVTDSSGLTPSCPNGSVVVGNAGNLTTFVAVTDSFGNPVSGLAAPMTVSIAKGLGGGLAPNPNSLVVNSGASVTSGSSKFELPQGSPADTAYTASGGGYAPATCTVKKLP